MPRPRKSLFDEPYREIIESLVRRRQEIGMTQTQLADAFGEDQSFISRIERLQRRVDVYEYAVLCRILRLDPARPLEGITRRTRRRRS